MKKIIAAVFSCFILVSVAHAQKKQQKDYSKEDEKIYNKLANLYTMDKYVKCIEACDDYIQDEGTARSPYPYLYMSMCYLAIHQDQESFDMKKYRDPLKKSLSYMGRFKKKDKAGDVTKDNLEFLHELRKSTLIEAATLDGKKDNKNLQNLAREIAKDYDKDEGMLLISGVYLIHSEAKPEGERAIETGMNMLKKRKDDNNLKFDADQTDALVQAVILYTDYLTDMKDTAKAKSTIQLAKDLIPENEKINKQAEKIGA